MIRPIYLFSPIFPFSNLVCYNVILSIWFRNKNLNSRNQYDTLYNILFYKSNCKCLNALRAIIYLYFFLIPLEFSMIAMYINFI